MEEIKFGNKLLEILVKHGMIQPEVAREAEEKALTKGELIEKYLADNNIVSPADMTLAISEYLDMPPIVLDHFVPDSQLMELVPTEVLYKYKALPVARLGKTLTVALGDPFDVAAVEELHIATGLDIIPVVAPEKSVTAILEKHRNANMAGLNMAEIMQQAEGTEVETAPGDTPVVQESLEQMLQSASDRPVIKMVNMLLIEAVRMQASDIHIEPQEDYVRVRYRVDGQLLERPSLPKSLQSAIVSRIRILADLDIGEQRLPQDGRFRINALGKTLDVRVSIIPTIFGGRVVLRLLDKAGLFPNLAALGMDQRAYEAMSFAIQQPHGIILVTGPTGSGKTTTLYSCLQELNQINVNIVTCEDPVEYQIPGIIQVKINEAVGCTFASALRAILRQDPDIVLIGEIRDAETAEIAIKASLTGHLVLSTLHTNDACGTITRLLDMGMEPFLVASSLILSQAQRLYRKLCPACRKPVDVPLNVLQDYHIPLDFFGDQKIYGPGGCPRCFGTGYKGRAAIMEVLPIDDDIRSAIMRQAIADEIREIAERKGMIGLKRAALERVKEGLTSLEVALKIAGNI
jgi:type IV pilus assembly protein PilB